MATIFSCELEHCCKKLCGSHLVAGAAPERMEFTSFSGCRAEEGGRLEHGATVRRARRFFARHARLVSGHITEASIPDPSMT